MQPVLKVFAATATDRNISIVGSEEALKRLRSAIDEALKTSTSCSQTLSESDGKDYTVSVRILDAYPTDRDYQGEWEKLPLHYTVSSHSNNRNLRDFILGNYAPSELM